MSPEPASLHFHYKKNQRSVRHANARRSIMKYGVLIGALFATVFLATGAQAQTAGRIANSPHDLSSGVATNADKNEVCVYCHTPHGAASTADTPLWNKVVPTTTFTLYDSTTIDGEILTAGPGGV